MVGFLSERKSWRQRRDHLAALSDRETEAAIKGHTESTRPPEAPPRDVRGQLQGGEGATRASSSAQPAHVPAGSQVACGVRPHSQDRGLRAPARSRGPSAPPAPRSSERPLRPPAKAASAPVDASSRCQAPSRVCPPPGPPGARPPTPSQLRLGGGARPGPKRGPDAAAASATCHRPGRLLLPRPRPPQGLPAGSSRDA